MIKVTYGQLLNYIWKKLNFKQDKRTKEWKSNCNGTLRFVNQFLKSKKISKEVQKNVIKKLENTGGYCDCEVVWNSSRRIRDNTRLK